MMGASGMVSFPDRPKRYWIPSPIQRRVGFLPRRKALYMLPVCKCFTSPTETIRTHGCSLCTSPINKKTARHFAEYGDEIIQVFLVVCVCVSVWYSNPWVCRIWKTGGSPRCAPACFRPATTAPTNAPTSPTSSIPA